MTYQTQINNAIAEFNSTHAETITVSIVEKVKKNKITKMVVIKIEGDNVLHAITYPASTAKKDILNAVTEITKLGTPYKIKEVSLITDESEINSKLESLLNPDATNFNIFDWFDSEVA